MVAISPAPSPASTMPKAPSRPVSTQWRDRAASRLKLEKALEETAGAVLRQITALGGAQ